MSVSHGGGQFHSLFRDFLLQSTFLTINAAVVFAKWQKTVAEQSSKSLLSIIMIMILSVIMFDCCKIDNYEREDRRGVRRRES